MAVPDFFGINLGHYSIKIFEVKPTGNKARLVSMGSTPTNNANLDADSEQGIELMANEIAKAAKASGVKTNNCVLSVPETAVFSRLLTLPKVKDEEIEQTIHWALKPLVPIPLEDVNVSYLQIDEKVLEGNTFVNWYVVAAPKQLITKYVQVMEKAKLNLLAVETEALALTRMIQYNYAADIKKDVMILDLGAESTNVVLARNGVVIFSQSISTGSNALTKVIAADFGLDMVQAEKYKLSFGMDFSQGEGKIAKSMEPILQILLGEINRTLAYYKEKIGGENISSIFLTGGGSNLIKFDEYLTQKLGTQALVADPIKNVDMDNKKREELAHTNIRSFNVAIGLALKGTLE